MENFNGINGNKFNENNQINIMGYFNGCNCQGIFFKNCEHLLLGINTKKEYLIKIFKNKRFKKG